MAPSPAGIVRCPGCGTKNRVPAGASGVPKCGKCAAPLPWVTQAGDDDYDEVVGRAAVPVLVDLIEGDRPSGRYRADELAGVSTS